MLCGRCKLESLVSVAKVAQAGPAYKTLQPGSATMHLTETRGAGREDHGQCMRTLTADAHFLPPAYLLMKSRMGPDLNSPSNWSAVAGSPLQTTSKAGALSTPNVAAISPSPRT